MKPKQLDEWDLTPKAKRIVRKEIRVWIKHFIKCADGKKGTPRQLDFKNNDVFFFTDCKDIQKIDDPNRDRKISIRKRNVMHQLFLRYLINDKITIERPVCKRCGHATIDSIGVGHTYMTICPNCGNLILRGDMNAFGFNANAVLSLAGDDVLNKYKNTIDGNWQKK